MDLLLDIKTIIAAYDQEVWYLLYRHDQEFHDYAVTSHAISWFIELFTVKMVGLDHIEYRLLGHLHRRDLPAIFYADGDQAWYQRGAIHRDNDLPAVICANGDQWWCQRGLCHRDNDLPTLILANGDQYWYHGGQYRRDPPAAQISDTGTVL
jgi:hypothetical protein